MKSDVDNIFRFAQDHMTEVENEEERNEDEVKKMNFKKNCGCFK